MLNYAALLDVPVDQLLHHALGVLGKVVVYPIQEIDLKGSRCENDRLGR